MASQRLGFGHSLVILATCLLVLVNCLSDNNSSVISRISKSKLSKTTNESLIDQSSDGDSFPTVTDAVFTTVVSTSESESTTEGGDDETTTDAASTTSPKPSSPVISTMTVARKVTANVRKHKSLADDVVVPVLATEKTRVNVIADALFPLLETMIISPISDDVPEERCRNHSRIFHEELANFKLWAVQMVDASSNFPSGILSGSTYQLGHFDECLGVDVLLPRQPKSLKGQYCLAEIEFGPQGRHETPGSNILWGTPDHNTSAWIKIKGDRGDRRLRRRDVLHWAVCIPDSCSAADLQMSMDRALQQFASVTNLDVSVQVQTALCQIDTGFFSRLTLGDYLMVAVIFAFAAMVGAGTLHDLMRPKKHPARNATAGKLLQCFSAKCSLENWVRVDASRDMIPVHFVRFGSMIGILMGHHFIADASSPLLNAEFLEQAANNILCLPLLVIPALVVDSFFLVSGFLTTRFILLDLDRNKLKVFAGYMHRFLRLTPVYMLMVGFHATLLGKVGTGPLWPTRLARDQVRCSKNWWTNLLYINNYVNTDELCLFQSWHVACDLHFSLIAPVLVICLWKRPRTGLSLIAFLAAATITALYVITWVWDLDPILMSFINVMTDLSADPTFRLQYIPTHTRGLPYLFGILAAYFHYKNPFSKKQLSQRMVMFCWAVTVVLMTSPIVGAVVFYSPDYSPAAWMAPMYAALHRIPWCIGQAAIIVIGITGNAGFMQKILDFKLIVPLSRLSYCVFLVHNAVQLFMGASVRSPSHLGPATILWMLLGDITVTYTIALAVHLVFEAPVQRLDKTFFTKADTKTKEAAALPSTTTEAASNGNGWKQNLGYEKGSDEIATICNGVVNGNSSVAPR